jgi:hypothetical protein
MGFAPHLCCAQENTCCYATTPSFFFDLVFKSPFLLCTGMHLLLCNRSSLRLQQGLVQNALDDAKLSVQLCAAILCKCEFSAYKANV